MKNGIEIEDGKRITENDSQEQKQDEHKTLETNGTNISSGEKTEIRETSSEKLNELTQEQSSTELSNVNSLESEEHENLLNSNIKLDEESAPSTEARLNSKDTHSDICHYHSKSNSSPNDFSESSAVEHDSGSHRSPDRKSKVEYRKIKSEVTGEGETSESEGEEKDSDTSARDNEQSQDTWMDILGNGLLKKRVINIYHHIIVALVTGTP